MLNHTGPFVPTGKKEIDIIKEELVKQGSKSFIDLGSGDGKVIYKIAGENIHTTGYENSFFLYIYSKYRKYFSRNGKYIDVKLASLFDSDLQKYDSVFIYGIPGMMEKVQTKILAESKKGTLVMSNSFEFPNLNLLYKVGKIGVYKV